MPEFAIREEVVNVLLAELLQTHGLLSVPEVIRKAITDQARNIPDILIADLHGVRVAIEGRFETSNRIASGLLEDVRGRVENGVAPVCIGALYPRSLRSISSLPELKRRLETVRLNFRVVSETNEGSWATGSVADIAEALRRSYEMLVSEDTVSASVDELDSAIDKAAELTIQSSLKDRFREALSIPRTTSRIDFDEDMKVCRIACLTLANAMIFQQVLANTNRRVKTVSSVVDQPDAAQGFHSSWGFIIKEIDYWPIFLTADAMVTDMIGIADADNALRILAAAAIRITLKRTSLRHDLMGRIYHLLLKNAKYFGAFYTSIPAATLLTKLAIDTSGLPADWSHPEAIANLRAADLACGTGTLLKSVVQVFVDNHVRASVESGEMPNLDAVHKACIEHVLWGLDVVPAAIHLAGSALALHDPDVEIDNMNLYTLPTAGATSRLGSIDLFSGREVPAQADLFSVPLAPARQQNVGQMPTTLNMPMLDVCIMNPPFTRSVGGNLLFGHVSEADRQRMQKTLKQLIARDGIPANVTAGLGSVFVALGNRLLKEGGVMALVLPRALLSGISWAETRALLGNNYQVRYIIVSHEPQAWNFSENTDLSECLIIARKAQNDDAREPTKVVNLWKRPGTSVEALSVASQVGKSLGANLESHGSEEIRITPKKYGEVVSWSAKEIQSGNWGEPAAFAQTELTRVAFFLRRGKIYIPGTGMTASIPTLPLGAVATLGPDCRDIHDAFSVTDEATEFKAFWGHATGTTDAMAANPNAYLRARSRALEGRHKRDPHLMWSRAGRILLAERLRLTTAKVIAIRSPVRMLSNTWWPLTVRNGETDVDELERILMVWLNSTLGIVSLLASRVETSGAWIKLKKPILQELRVLNVRVLRAKQKKILTAAYDQLCKQPLLPIKSIGEDQTRAELDSVVASAFGIAQEISIVRDLLQAEPLISASIPGPITIEKKLAAPTEEMFPEIRSPKFKSRRQ